MHISHETPQQTEQRLRAVFADTELVWHGHYRFVEGARTTLDANDEALAFVRDGAAWSALVPAGTGGGEVFAIFSCHFPTELDNSGFVGWLASTLKRELGTGVFVICGHNASRGGVFDYWGVPVAVEGPATTLLERLKRGVVETPGL